MQFLVILTVSAILYSVHRALSQFIGRRASFWLMLLIGYLTITTLYALLMSMPDPN